MHRRTPWLLLVVLGGCPSDSPFMNGDSEMADSAVTDTQVDTQVSEANDTQVSETEVSVATDTSEPETDTVPDVADDGEVACVPDCINAMTLGRCGDDGCGGSCGCPSGSSCDNGVCACRVGCSTIIDTTEARPLAAMVDDTGHPLLLHRDVDGFAVLRRRSAAAWSSDILPKGDGYESVVALQIEPDRDGVLHVLVSSSESLDQLQDLYRSDDVSGAPGAWTSALFMDECANPQLVRTRHGELFVGCIVEGDFALSHWASGWQPYARFEDIGEFDPGRILLQRHWLPAAFTAGDDGVHAAVACCGWNDYQLDYAHSDGGEWASVALEEVYGSGTRQVGVALDALEHPHVVYSSPETSELVHQRFDGNNWQRTTVVSVLVQPLLLIADERGGLHLLGREAGTLRYRTWSSPTTGWSESADAPFAMDPNTDLALTVDASQTAHVLYRSNTDDIVWWTP